MKKLILMGAVLLSLMATSCSNEDIIDNGSDITDASGTVTTLQANIKGSADTRITVTDGGYSQGLKFNWYYSNIWNFSDYIKVFPANSSSGTMFYKTAEDNNTFKFSPLDKNSALAAGQEKYYAVFAGNYTKYEDRMWIKDLMDQYGDASDNEKGVKTIMVAETTDLTQPLTFEHKTAVLKIHVTLPVGTAGPIKEVTVSGMHYTATYYFETKEFSYTDTGLNDITARGSDNKGFTIGDDNTITVYIGVFPETVAANQVTINIIANNDETYSYTLTKGKTLKPGTVVPINLSFAQVNGHDFVDLGLPSKTKWATMNVGANKPEEFGNYYAWGETTAKTSFTASNYLNGKMTFGNVYVPENDPMKDSLNIAGDTQYDAAAKAWGGTWKMPTQDQIYELFNTKYTTYEKTTVNGVEGYTITSKTNGKSIFLPLCGLYTEKGFSNTSNCYWTSEQKAYTYYEGEYFGGFAHTIYISSDRVNVNKVSNGFYRYNGCVIRPVSNTVMPVSDTWVKPNFKSAYTKEDYKTWSTDNCGSAPTVDQIKMYLGAGVYWDAGTDTDNQQTYTVNGSVCHAGLWVKKKAYISGFSAGTAKKVDYVSSSSNSDCWHEGRPTEINKYFFLPATGHYYSGSIRGAGSGGRYWSSSPDDDDYAYCLDFYDSYAEVCSYGRDYGYLPMSAE